MEVVGLNSYTDFRILYTFWFV